MGRLEVNHGACEGAGRADDTGEVAGRYREMADLPLLNREESIDIDAEKLEQIVLALLS